ncbi:MAG: hypothetical protein CSA95_08260 [Bacteroidetes bacterium]|nr:MAG: hypothetical protein CSA95_08260 [Bacteroidota bacterium]PIE87906.1 MAG: hypothetical protein CSA04_04630 [Bacteroidota bacterium]
MRDFTLKKYHLLIETLLSTGYRLLPVVEFLCFESPKAAALRHDVDRYIQRAMEMANMEHELGLKASYFFRKKDIIRHPQIIAQIASLNHEIGYHYENLAAHKGNPKEAIKDFSETLEHLRKIAWVDGISMHGSPCSRHHNRAIWEIYNYRNYGIGYEITNDIHYEHILYLTDTGRRWDYGGFNLRDKVYGKRLNRGIVHTNHLLKALQSNLLAPLLIFNIHPQRWDNRLLPWFAELVGQTLKNKIKRLIRFRHEPVK